MTTTDTQSGAATQASQLHTGTLPVLPVTNVKQAGRGGGIYLWCRVEDGDLDAFYAQLRGKGVEVVDSLTNSVRGS